jgi:UDPglucose--hexose-1-phosphate uridylyltransferase
MPQLRKDPVVGRWVIISTEREKTPLGFRMPKRKFELTRCPFCPGQEKNTPPEIFALRPEGSQPNDSQWRARVIPNKFPYLRVEGDLGRKGVGMYDMMNGIGAHEIIIETPEHEARIEDLSFESVISLQKIFISRYKDLKNDSRLHYILLFRNQGLSAGAIIPHPHSQLIATPILPKRVEEELVGARDYFRFKGRCVFCDMIIEETDQNQRIVYENAQFIAFCPFASRFPFEIWVLPKRHSPDFDAIDDNALYELADVLKTTLKKLTVALNDPDYNLCLHSGPIRWKHGAYWHTIDQDFHWHIEIMPRITALAGFEWGTGFYKNPTPPEKAAEYLREVEA